MVSNNRTKFIAFCIVSAFLSAAGAEHDMLSNRQAEHFALDHKLELERDGEPLPIVVQQIADRYPEQVRALEDELQEKLQTHNLSPQGLRDWLERKYHELLAHGYSRLVSAALGLAAFSLFSQYLLRHGGVPVTVVPGPFPPRVRR
jgi:hypothetical protein